MVTWKIQFRVKGGPEYYILVCLLLSIQRMTKKRTKVYNARAEKLSHWIEWFNLYLALSVAISQRTTSETSRNHQFWNCSTCQLVNSDNQNDLSISKLLKNAIYRKRNFKAIRKQKTSLLKLQDKSIHHSLQMSYRYQRFQSTRKVLQ